MTTFIKELMNSRETQINHPCLFDDSNIKSLFGMLDVANTGYINYEQYKQGTVCVFTFFVCPDQCCFVCVCVWITLKTFWCKVLLKDLLQVRRGHSRVGADAGTLALLASTPQPTFLAPI